MKKRLGAALAVVVLLLGACTSTTAPADDHVPEVQQLGLTGPNS